MLESTALELADDVQRLIDCQMPEIEELDMQHTSDAIETPTDSGATAAVDGAGQKVPGLPILDTTAALELMDGDMDTLLMILELVRDQLPEDRRVIDSAIDAGDAPALRKASHRLKGVVGQIGAVRAHAACGALEAAAASAEVGAFGELQRKLTGELDALSAAISDYLSQRPASA